MTVAILDVRPTSESGVALYVGEARNFVPRIALESRLPHRGRLLCHSRPNPDGRVVCVWECAVYACA